MSENSFLRQFSAQVSQSVFLSLFDRFTAYYNPMTWNVRKLISLRFQCRNITNRFFGLFDRFTTYYNCMTWNVRKLISPPFQWTSITNRVLRLFDRFTWLVTTLWPLKFSENSYLREFSAQVSQSVFLAYIWPFLRLNLQLYDLKCQKTHYLR